LAWALIDTNVYVDHWERGLHEIALARLRAQYVVRQSSVVLCELLRGARTTRAIAHVERLRRAVKVAWHPSAEDWIQAGHLILDIGDALGWDRRKRRDFQNDALIALTARRHGAIVVTSNRGDFELLADRLGTRMLFI
jgi:predicted nucleic acid-binding protein